MTQMLKVIKSAPDLAEALARIEELMDRAPAAGTADANELEVLGVLVDEYETRVFPIAAPTPIEAIKARMEQEGHSNRDLVPLLGSRSKVSEVLSGDRQLTLAMIRALHDQWKIPAALLLKPGAPTVVESADLEWTRFPLAEMRSLGWIPKTRDLVRDPEAAMRLFFGNQPLAFSTNVLYRRTRHIRSARQMDEYALTAWLVRVADRARTTPVGGTFSPKTITVDILHEVAQLSWSSSGPRLAVEFLARLGIAVVIERHLTRTHLDGAAFIAGEGKAVVALTLRHDRLDNFWYSLMHELAHLSLHVRDDRKLYIDDLDLTDATEAVEREADDLAREALIPAHEWRQSAASRLRSPDAAIQLADKLRISPAIVAGRIRHERKNFRLLSQLVGAGAVRKSFPEVRWP